MTVTREEKIFLYFLEVYYAQRNLKFLKALVNIYIF